MLSGVGAIDDFRRRTTTLEGNSNQSAWSAASAIARNIRDINSKTQTSGAQGFLDLIVTGSRAKGYASDIPTPIEGKVSDYDFAVLFNSKTPGFNRNKLVGIVAGQLQDATHQNSIKDPDNPLKYVVRKEYNAHFFVDVACPDVLGNDYFDYLVHNSIVLGYWYLWEMQELPGEQRADALDLQKVFDEHRAKCHTLTQDQKERVFNRVYQWLTSDEVTRFSKMRTRFSERGLETATVATVQGAYEEDAKKKVSEFIGLLPVGNSM